MALSVKMLTGQAMPAMQVAFFRSALLGDDGPLQSLLGRDDQTVRWISPTSPSARAR